MPRPELNALRTDLELEWKAIERTLEDLTLISAAPADVVQLRAAASVLQDLYGGIESISSRIATVVDGDLPTGGDWHITLLRRMTMRIPSLRPAFLDEDLAADIMELLKFRHFLRHNYGFRLRRDRVDELLTLVPGLVQRFREAVLRFKDFLEHA